MYDVNAIKNLLGALPSVATAHTHTHTHTLESNLLSLNVPFCLRKERGRQSADSDKIRRTSKANASEALNFLKMDMKSLQTFYYMYRKITRCTINVESMVNRKDLKY